MKRCGVCRQPTAAQPCDNCGAQVEAGPVPAAGAPTLRVGDIVRWSGAWGSQAPILARVVGIDATETPGEKYGRDVDAIEWARVFENRAVLSLANGHWCYGYQVKPATAAEAADFTGRAN